MKVQVEELRGTSGSDYKITADGETVAMLSRNGHLVVFDPETPHDYNKDSGGGVIFSAGIRTTVDVVRTEEND